MCANWCDPIQTAQSLPQSVAPLQAYVPPISPKEIVALTQKVVWLGQQVQEQKEVIQLLVKLVRRGATHEEINRMETLCSQL